MTARRFGELATDERDSLTGTRVLSAVVFHTGSVRIVLSDGRHVTVRADEGNANWTLFSAEEALVVCTGGVVEVRA
ncbi:hypothetical protein F4561_001182 [Lipingzhangella halophila]|uniref:Uncharacterized protein n=1 Tax=Lipingzhangella halophila TaxID=1783352 RepID=A0A7W7RE80_9ACTN|nr:hypothetical protein [Lipingzhangella halophila]